MNKIVFITGASRGIGLSTAKKFASKGWKVAGFYNKNKGPEIDNTNWYQLEITDYKDIKEIFNKAFKDLGGLNCLVNCAGIFGYKDLANYDEKLIDRVISVNEKGTYTPLPLICSPQI